MTEILEIAVLIILIVAGITALYHLLPFRKLNPTKPKFVLFPKYLHDFSISADEVVSRIKEKGFVPNQSSEDTFNRGKIYGDFSAKAMKLRIIVERNESSIKIFAPFFGVFFDNGDLWDIANDITIEIEP